jgi:hypothetical protein
MLFLKPCWVAPSAYPTYLVYVGQVSGEATPPDNNDELIQLTAFNQEGLRRRRYYAITLHSVLLLPISLKLSHSTKA